MCGRFTQHTLPALIAARFGAKPPRETLPARYNIAPGSPILACRSSPETGRELVWLHWGLVPSWAKDVKSAYKMINARAETVAEKPAFRAAFRRRRCLIAADGFYEWQPATPRKQPWYIRLKGGEPFAFAGLWEHWEREGETLESCTIIVTGANALLAPIHDRMPVILAPEQYDLWLDPGAPDAAALKKWLVPFAADAMEAYPVSAKVSNPRNEGEELIAPVDDERPAREG